MIKLDDRWGTFDTACFCISAPLSNEFGVSAGCERDIEGVSEPALIDHHVAFAC